jgi:UDP-galactopyranose mutase
MRRENVIIIGAGPAGVAAAIMLGRSAVVLERQRDIGGLSGSFEIDGAVFDIGGHSFHTPRPEVRDLVFGSLEMYEQKREARCFSHGSMISYPFQKNFAELDAPAVVEECARGLRDADGGNGAANFEEFLGRRFGPGIANNFLLPYNRKLWGRDLTRISAEWVGERVAAPQGVRESFTVSGGQRKPLQDDTVVAYPARGGFGEITRALASKVQKLELGIQVKRVDPLRRELVTQSGETYKWRWLISTTPIHELLAITDGAPPEIREEASRLEYISLLLVNMVIGHPVDTQIQRIYSAEPDIPAHKIVINHNSSDYLRSRPRHGITGEVSHLPEKALERGAVEARFLESLLRLRLIKSIEEVVSVSVIGVKYAYPVPTIDRDAAAGRIKDWLEARGIYTAGRFGEWAYINSDEAIYRGLTLGRRLAGK